MTTKTNSRRDQAARELVRCLHESFRGSRAQLEVFSSQYLTTQGDAIVATAEPGMTDTQLIAIAYRALSAG